MLQYARFDQAVNHMSHGLCMFGPDERLIVCNARYIEMYGLDPAKVRPGIAHREVLEHWGWRSVAELLFRWVTKRLEALAARVPARKWTTRARRQVSPGWQIF